LNEGAKKTLNGCLRIDIVRALRPEAGTSWLPLEVYCFMRLRSTRPPRGKPSSQRHHATMSWQQRWMERSRNRPQAVKQRRSGRIEELVRDTVYPSLLDCLEMFPCSLRQNLGLRRTIPRPAPREQ